eukprot:1417728-Rhodomonas_salina.3
MTRANGDERLDLSGSGFLGTEKKKERRKRKITDLGRRVCARKEVIGAVQENVDLGAAHAAIASEYVGPARRVYGAIARSVCRTTATCVYRAVATCVRRTEVPRVRNTTAWRRGWVCTAVAPPVKKLRHHHLPPPRPPSSVTSLHPSRPLNLPFRHSP